MTRDLKHNKAHALILSLAVLMLLSGLAIQFSGMATVEMRASHNYQEMQESRLVAKAGIDYAVASISSGYKSNPLYFGWLYVKSDADADSNPGYATNKYADDGIGDGVTLANMQRVTATDHGPSFFTSQKIFNIAGVNLHCSGDINGHNNPYTLKVFDVAAQINLNNTNPGLATILNGLSWAVALREPYKSSASPFDSAGPLHGLGAQIVANRPSNGYQTKTDLVGISGSGKTISESDLSYVFDYLTTYPRTAVMQSNTTYQRVSFSTPGNETSYQRELRSPVNINTAPWPVLVAMFKGIYTSTTAISDDEAIVLANRVCLWRSSNDPDDTADMPFVSLKDFFDFLDKKKNSIFSTGTEAKVALLKANFNPAVFPRRLNPDKVVYQTITKADLLHHTSEFCFSPLGYFEISVRGECFDSRGIQRSVCDYYTVAHILDVSIQVTQKDFESNSRYSDLTDRVTNKQGFSQGNNLLKDGVDVPTEASEYFGMVQPVWYNPTTGYSTIDDPKEIPDGGTAPLGQGGTYYFKADFNATPDANKGSLTTAGGTKPAAFTAASGQTVPNASGTFCDFVADGVVFSSSDTNSDALYYPSRSQDSPENAAAAKFNNNFPKLIDSETGDSGTGNSGSLMFWFKINSDWKVDEWRTINFINTAYEIANGADIYTMGVQKEVQMKITEPDPGKPLLRKAQIQVRSKYFCLKAGVPVKPPDALMPYTHVDFGRRLVLDPAGSNGIQAQQWYHLSIRWKNGNTLNDFGGTTNQNSAVCVTGPLYNSANDQQSHFQAFDDGSSRFKLGDGSEVLTASYNDVKLNDPATTFQPLDGSPTLPLALHNRFNIGCVGRTNPPQATFDDFRVTTVTDWADKSEYLPSRFPLPNTDNIYAEFKGSTADLNGYEQLYTQTTVLKPDTNAAVSGSGSSTGTGDIITAGGESLFLSSWQSILDKVVENFGSVTLTSDMLLAPVKHFVVDTMQTGSGTWKKHIQIISEDDTTINLSGNFNITDDTEKTLYDFGSTNVFRGSPLALVLLLWMADRHYSLPDDGATTTTPGQQVNADTDSVTGSDKNYDIKFGAGSNTTAIYASAAVIQIVSVRTRKVIFEEFRELTN